MSSIASNGNEDKSNRDAGQSLSGAGPNDGVDTTTTPLKTYSLSNDVLGPHSDQNPDYNFAENQEVQLADNLGTPKTDFALGSLPSNTGTGESNTDYQAFAPDQNTLQSTNQYKAALLGQGNSNILALGGNSNTDDSTTGQAKTNTDTGADTQVPSSGNDNIFGAYKPSSNLFGADSTTAPLSGIDQTVQTV